MLIGFIIRLLKIGFNSSHVRLVEGIGRFVLGLRGLQKFLELGIGLAVRVDTVLLGDLLHLRAVGAGALVLPWIKP